MTVNEVMQDWIQSANEGRLKIGKRDLTNDECALIGEVFGCVAEDLLMCEQPRPSDREEGKK